MEAASDELRVGGEGEEGPAEDGLQFDHSDIKFLILMPIILLFIILLTGILLNSIPSYK